LSSPERVNRQQRDGADCRCRWPTKTKANAKETLRKGQDHGPAHGQRDGDDDAIPREIELFRKIPDQGANNDGAKEMKHRFASLRFWPATWPAFWLFIPYMGLRRQRDHF